MMNYGLFMFILSNNHPLKSSPTSAVQVPTNGTQLWMPQKWQDQWWYMVVEPSIVLVMKQQKLGYHNIPSGNLT